MSFSGLSNKDLSVSLRKKRLELRKTLKDLCNEIKKITKISISTLSLFERSKLNQKSYDKYRPHLICWLSKNGEHGKFFKKTSSEIKLKTKNNKHTSFGSTFKQLRLNLNYTQKNIYKMLVPMYSKIKFHPNTISLFETNKLPNKKFLELQIPMELMYKKLKNDLIIIKETQIEERVTLPFSPYFSPLYSPNEFRDFEITNSPVYLSKIICDEYDKIIY